MSAPVTSSTRHALPSEATAVPRTDGAARVAILEDDLVLGQLAADLCRGIGVEADTYMLPAVFLEAARTDPPRALVLDWRLHGQLGAAAYMAVRHRYPAMPVVCWTASPAWNLPQMLHDDPMTRVIDKAAGAMTFEAAVRWATG